MRRLAIAAALALTACSPNGCGSGGAPAVKTEDGSAPTPPVPEPTPVVPEPVTWPHEGPGALLPGTGTGIADSTIWAPGMRFPLESGPAYSNSQVWGYGGMTPPGPGTECAAPNYSYPWRDNFCENRSWTNGMCPGDAKGHQGQDIRPSTCVKDVHWAVAAEAGTVVTVDRYMFYILGDSGRRYSYLHMRRASLLLAEGDRVTRGQRLGTVSNDMTRSGPARNGTTIHLHFEIKAPVTANGSTAFMFVSPYASLVDSYQRLLEVTPAPTA